MPSMAQTNDTREGIYNIGFGAVFGGIGAIITKDKDEKLLKVFVKGMGQGPLGGYVVFESKRLIRNFSETGNYGYIWPSRILNSAGNSIMENAASNRNFYEQWNLHIGFNRIEILTKDKLKLRYRFMPWSFGNLIRTSTEGSLDISRTLKTGIPVFKTSRDRIIEDSNGGFAQGWARGNTIAIFDGPLVDKESVLSHEIIHVYQNESFVVFNPYLNKTIENSISEKITDTKVWKSIYLDLNNVYFYTAHRIDAEIKDNYFKQFFEQEAFYYQNK